MRAPGRRNDIVFSMRSLFLWLVAIVSVWGQSSTFPPIYRLPAELRDYLALTVPQAIKIAEQNNEFARWSSARSMRMSEVQSEIAIETAREPLDPAALGVRYAEVEAVRREITERNTKLIAANVAVLTPAQVVKLKALEEAMKLVTTSSQAQSLKLLPDACSVPTLAIRRGDFAPAVPARVILDPVAGGLGYSIFGSSCAPQLTLGGVFVP
jgi:hypothetical protein